MPEALAECSSRADASHHGSKPSIVPVNVSSCLKQAAGAFSFTWIYNTTAVQTQVLFNPIFFHLFLNC